MDLEQQLPSFATHGLPGARTFPNSRSSSPQKEDDHQFRFLELKKTGREFCLDVLLSRAHFLLFSSLQKEADAQEGLIQRAKAILGAVAQEFTPDARQDDFSDRITAKFQYVQGFQADISRETRAAKDHYQKATDFDNQYRTLRRVQWYLQGEQTHEEINMAWSEGSPWSTRGSGTYRFGDIEDSLFSRPGSSASDIPASVLRSLLSPTTLSESKQPPSDSRSNVPSTPPGQIDPILTQHSLPLATPPGARLDIDAFLKARQDSPSRAAKRARQKAEAEAKERDDRLWERNHRIYQRGQSQRDQLKQLCRESASRQPSIVAETDTPGLTELDPAYVPANRSAAGAASPTLTIHVQGHRKMSTTGTLSPAPSSPLRKSSLPSDVETGVEGSWR